MSLPEGIQKELANQAFIKNFYRQRKMKDTRLLTTDHGTWVNLSEADYADFLNDQLSGQLYDDLLHRGFIITKDNFDEIVQKYYKRYKGFESGASLHIIVPTIRCNLRCLYCHSEAAAITEGSQYDMSEEILKRTLEFIFDSPKEELTIEFQGGEPLLNKPLVKLAIEYAAELNKKYNKRYRFALVSNFTALDEEFLDFLCEHKDQIKLSTSLDGPKHVHDKNRQFVHSGSGSYDQVTRWLERCKEKGLWVGLLMVTTRYSLPYWKEIIDEYVKWDQKEIQIKPLDYLGYAVEVWDEIGYTMEEFIQFWQRSVDYIFELLDQGVILHERHIRLALKNILYEVDTGYMDWSSPCGMIRGQIVYNYNGDIYCCDEARIVDDLVIGNVLTDRYLEIIHKNQSRDLIQSSILEGYYCDSCAYKPYCGVCPVLHFGQEKNFALKLNKTNRCQLNRAVLDVVFEKLIYDRKKVQQLIVGMMLKLSFGKY